MRTFMSYIRPAFLSIAVGVVAFGCGASKNQTQIPGHSSKSSSDFIWADSQSRLPNGAILEKGALRLIDGKRYVPLFVDPITISGLEIDRPGDLKLTDVQLFFDGKRHPEAKTYVSLNIAKGQAYIAGSFILRFQEDNPLAEIKSTDSIEIISHGDINFSIKKQDTPTPSLIKINSSPSGSMVIKYSIRTIEYDKQSRRPTEKNTQHTLSIESSGKTVLTSTTGSALPFAVIARMDEPPLVEIYLIDNNNRLKQFKIKNRIAGRRIALTPFRGGFLTFDFSPREIPNKPLICIPGDRPDYVPFDPYQHGSACSINDAKKYYDMIIGKHKDRCENATQYIKFQEICDSIPLVVYLLGSHNIPHPLMDSVYYFDLFGINDFRSGQVIMEAADHPRMAELVSKKRSLTMLYPASGSHMAPFLIPMKLMDRGLIDNARVIYTEIDPKSEERVSAYLNFLKEKNAISSLKRKNLSDLYPGRVVRYDFDYKGKPTEFLFALNRTHGDAIKYYSPYEYVAEADLIIFHDGVEEDQANNIFGILGSKPRLILADASFRLWSLPRRTGIFRISDSTYLYETFYFNGFYGCQKAFIFEAHRYEPEDGRLVDKGPWEGNEVHSSSYPMSAWGAHLIKTPPISSLPNR